MSLTLTDEQSAIIHWQGQTLVVNAFAGTGKTSTLVQYALANPDSRMLYLACNRAVRDEAERKFPFYAECKTSHQLAWSRFGRHYRNRLVASQRITDVARKLNTRHWLLVHLALSSLNQFLCSADKEPGLQHLPDEDARAGTDVSAILQAVQVLWHEMSRLDGTFPVTHDTCLKLFQLSSPDLFRRWDTILFDEAQDANPVTSALVLCQSCRVILVGDRYQQIYRFCGADNALFHPVLNDVDRLWLTQSFRFSSSVARMANLLLQRAGETRQVTSSGGEDEILMSCIGADKSEGHQTVLSRTVAGVICTALMVSLSGRNVYRMGGIEGYRTETLEDLYWFSVEMPEKMQPDVLRRDYRDFDAYCRIAKSTWDVELNQAIRLLDICFPLPLKLKLIQEHTVTSEKEADITVSMTHRSKGLEWPVVKRFRIQAGG